MIAVLKGGVVNNAVQLFDEDVGICRLEHVPLIVHPEDALENLIRYMAQGVLMFILSLAWIVPLMNVDRNVFPFC